MTDYGLTNAPNTLQPANPSELTVRAWLRVLILLGMGAYFAYNIVTGDLANYINARFVWLSYVAAGLFLLLGVASAVRVIRQSRAGAKPTARALTWGVLAVGAVPLILGTMIPSSPLGANAVNGNISTSAVRGANTSTFTVAPEKRNILDWLRAFNDSDDFAEFNGQPVNVTGFVYREPGFGKGELMVARFTVSCCVADASALGLPLAYTAGDEIEAGTWVQVEGTLQVGAFGDDVLPVVQVASLTTIDQPQHPYLYP